MAYHWDRSCEGVPFKVLPQWQTVIFLKVQYFCFFGFFLFLLRVCLLCTIKLQMVDGVLANVWDWLFQTTYSITFLCSHIIYCNTDSVYCFVNWMSVLNCMPFDDSVLCFMYKHISLNYFFVCFIRFYNGCVLHYDYFCCNVILIH